ncbi:MAG: hypothetical protein Q4D77_02230, partial [Peptostreptococcaceae bacterium]|nr:hypothetical protein [Peptostreptococcaceae bacterium]
MNKFKKALSVLTAFLMVVTMVNVGSIHAFADSAFGDLAAQVEQGLKVGNENVNADATVVTLSVKDNGNTQAVADATFEILNFGDHASFKMDSTNKKVLVNTKLAEAKEYQIKVKAMAPGYTTKEFTEEEQIIKITVAPADPKTFGDLAAQVEQGLKVGNE